MPQQEAEPVITTQGLSKNYGDIEAVKQLDLDVPRHSIFAFLGPNGAGKSTTIKLLLGLASPSAGTGRVFGHDIVSESTEIRKHVGYLAQGPKFYDRLTARQTLRFVAEFFYSGPRDLIEERVQETLELVGLEAKADRPVGGFSGGERQRLGIAQAQVNYPDLLILDEPAASLDPMGRHDVLEIMERLRKYATVFYSTHILDDVQRVSDTVAIMNHGELVAMAPIEQLLAGSEGTVYSLTVRGDGAQAEERISAAPWAASVFTTRNGQTTAFKVATTDTERAEAELLRLVLADSDVVVTGFGRQQQELEDVFMRIVREGE